jgi:hypothetical protein
LENSLIEFYSRKLLTENKFILDCKRKEGERRRMKTKFAKIVSTLLIASMLMGIALVTVPTASAAVTKVKLIPSPQVLGSGHVDVIGTTFQVACVIEDVTNLYGFGIKIYINETYFQYVSHSTSVPWDTHQTPQSPSPYAGILYAPYTPVADTYHSATHILEVAYSSQSPAPSFNGSGTVCVMTLRVIAQPYDYEIAPADFLDVYVTFNEIKLAGYGVPPPPIDFDPVSCDVQLWSRTFAYPAIPQLDVRGIGEITSIVGKGISHTFTVDVWLVTDVFWDPAGFDMRLTFDQTLIEAVKSEVDPDGDFGSFWSVGSFPFINMTDNINGYVRVAFVGIGSHTPVYGKLKILTVTFHEIYEATIPADIKSCDLTLMSPPPRPHVTIPPDNQIVCPIDIAGFPRPDRPMSPWNSTPYSVPIPSTISKAIYTCHYKPLGRAIDVFTQYEDPFGGQGPGANSSMYWPQKEVILYANVTYNLWPEQQKDVAFQIIDPYGVTYALLCNRTNADGIAMVSFRLPWMCDDPTYYFGLWEVMASVDVACQHINDTLHFKYDYKVHIWKVTTDKTDYDHYEDVTVFIEYGSNAQLVYPIVFAVTGLDETGVPWDINYVQVPVGGAQWCTYNNGKANVTLTIPKWARAGVATIDVNALDAWPTAGGVQEFPLYWVTINISADK